MPLALFAFSAVNPLNTIKRLTPWNNHNNTKPKSWNGKESWHDDFLKWICGFANAQGGKLVIGRNDKGETVGVKNAQKLMEDLPNKIRSTMGVVVTLELRTESTLNLIEITVPAYSNPISYHGKYYLRSGNTNQELSGYALDALLLGKYGRTYDSMPIPNVKLEDFWHDTFELFRKKAIASKRLTTEDATATNKELLHSLNLLESDYPSRAAILLFHQAPEEYCHGAYVKVGYFTPDAEILYQDELNGSLIGMADKVLGTIFSKYFIGRIRYEGLQRIDDYPMPSAALREALMNALVHRDYSTGSPVQIRVYDDRLTIANDCRLPEGTTAATLVAAHKSLAINPLIAATMFRSGQIEAWGRGLERIVKLCIADKLPEPEFIITPRTFTICFHTRNNRKAGNIPNEPLNEPLNETVTMEQRLLQVLREFPTITKEGFSRKLGSSRATITRTIKSLVASGDIRRIGSKKTGHWEVTGKESDASTLP